MTTNEFQVPEPEYGPDDFATATDRVRQARESLLTNSAAADAHGRLSEDIEALVGRKQLNPPHG